MSKYSSRRNFIQKISAGALGAVVVPEILKADHNHEQYELLQRNRPFGPNDNIQIALIGAGGMGFADANTAITTPGVKLVAACDLYNGRLDAAKNKYGKDIFTTRDYRELLLRKDIDAVIVATPDHWHKDISVAAMNAGKAVYCEKPMTVALRSMYPS